MTSKYNAVITLQAQNDESAVKAVEILGQILVNSGRKTVLIFDNSFNLIARINPMSPNYKLDFVYIYVGKISSYNIGSWTETLSGVCNNSIRCPSFYFYKYEIPNRGLNSGCNSNFNVLCPDINDRLSVTLRLWNII